jgi:hypothetical protein
MKKKKNAWNMDQNNNHNRMDKHNKESYQIIFKIHLKNPLSRLIVGYLTKKIIILSIELNRYQNSIFFFCLSTAGSRLSVSDGSMVVGKRLLGGKRLICSPFVKLLLFC